MMDLAKRPFPLIKFSPNNSGTTCLILDMLTWSISQSRKRDIEPSQVLAHLVDQTIDTLS